MKKLGLVLGIGLSLWLSVAQAQQAVVVPATTTQVAVAGTVAASTKIISGITGKQIYVTALNLIPVATAVVTFTYGTGTNCGTGTGSLTGAMTFATGQVLSAGNGYGAVFVVPLTTPTGTPNDLCVTIATAAAPGSIAYSIF